MLFLDYCKDLGPIIGIIHAVVVLIQFIIPIGLIIFGTIDLGKAVISSKEEEMKKAQNALIKRVIYAVAVFLVVIIVRAVMNIVVDNANSNAKSWAKCWDKF